MSAIKYWLWLASLRHINQAEKVGLYDCFGSPENVYFAQDTDLSANLSAAALAELSNKSLERSERILEQCARLDISLITMQDAMYPERLRHIYNPPLVLYYKGKLPCFDEEPVLAVVGTRKCTSYGINVASKMGYQLAKSGMLIISGMADGIDTEANIAALRAGKTTVAVLGSGADVIYPATNKALYEDIISAGAVVSEYPPGTRPAGENFPRRNRIMSGLSLGCLVVEAPLHSGALITARYALEQGRDVFAVPGNIDNAESLGCNNLIREGAELVTSAGDILIEYAIRFPHKITQNLRQPPPIAEEKRVKIEERQKTVKKTVEKTVKEDIKPFDLTALIEQYSSEQKKIIVTIAAEPRNIDDIITTTQLSASEVLRELTMLEIAGIVKQLPGKRFVFIKPPQ